MARIQLRGGLTSIVIDDDGAMPQIVYFGPLVDSDPASLASEGDDGAGIPSVEGTDVFGLLARPIPKASLNQVVPLGLVAEHAAGFEGRPGFLGSRPDGSAWSPRFSTERETEVERARATFYLHDPIAELALMVDVNINQMGTVELWAELTNVGSTPYDLLRLAPSIPLPSEAAEILSFTGRWCREFHPERHPLTGTFLIENRQGRTSHERLPAVVAGTPGFGEQHGRVVAAQLAWSGNYEIAVERLVDDHRHIQMGELLWPGEVCLQPGQRYRSPTALSVWSHSGLQEVSRRFHRDLRSRMTLHGQRKVMLNTWEAVYFDHRLDTLIELADRAGEVGVERFVLDDGWFGARRDATKGLGDWVVSAEVWPDGLDPLIEHVKSKGMDFGLWFEPEMVNPDSDLYRAHPEWALTTDGYEPLLARNQLVLDFGRSEVRDYIVAAVGDVLARYDIAYVKWDMNRRVVQGSGATGSAGSRAHVLGLYDVLDRLRTDHPSVEIESCSSGGGRVDAEILTRTQRVWTSDCNDAVERQRIQNGFSLFFPPEVMGAHVGPEAAHTTGRQQWLGFRIGTALFGHFGIEWNLLEATEAELRHLAGSIEVYKELRPLLHGGQALRFDPVDPGILVHGVVGEEQARALVAFVQIESTRSSVPPVVRLPGLLADGQYRVCVRTDLESFRLGGDGLPAWWDRAVEGGHAAPVVGGAQLAEAGLQLPVLLPESVLLLDLRQVSATT